jgi:hypothetical protein
MKKTKLAVLVLFCAFLNPTAHAASCVGGDCFEIVSEIAGQKAPLRGNALFRYLGFRLYTAALYTAAPKTWTPQQILAGAPKRLVIRYARSIRKEQIIEAAEKNLRANPAVSWEKIETRVRQLNGQYQNVEKGDEYVLTYVPGRGTSLELNGKLKTTVPGEDFARAYFGIWLSERPINPALRLHLFGKEN